MADLTNDLLALTRLGRQALVLETLDPMQMVKELTGRLRAALKGRNVEWVFDIGWVVGAAPACRADRSLLRQVFFNLLDNAAKFTRGRDPARIEVGSYVKDEARGTSQTIANPPPSPSAVEAVYFVRDNGVGFDMKHAHKLFHVFQRLHNAVEFEGRGVGLALVKHIIDLHGGRVWGEGAVDRRATFSFSLPGAVRHAS